MKRPRYIAGIDLGTTNSALAYVDTARHGRAVHSLPIPQLVAEGRIAERPTLPSFLYIGGEHDVAPGDLALPWDEARAYAVGEFARVQGARVPGRLVTSAKSWLCHGGVDRQARILPWAGAEDVVKVSPVEASARYLQHLREAWLQSFPDDPLEEQDVVLTVPASFDEVARELTVEAAERAGLPRVVLLEEPQAAFYAWIQANEVDWKERLAEVDLALVVDIGGGTTDFSLIAVRRAGEGVELERLAVGDHLLLGGDNIDVALARMLEPRLGTKLDSQRWQALTNLCRAAKEDLLAADGPAQTVIRIAGRGRALVGGVVSAPLTAVEVEQLVLEGFFPLVDPEAAPRKTARLGLQEWGLPFANEPEVTRHLAAFLRQHRREAGAAAELACPDAVLFNGGALKPPLVRERLAQVLGSWNDGRAPAVLHSSDLDLAVARGAAYYGLVRRGLGVRIGGGSPRAYYLGVKADDVPPDTVAALCVAPRGMHEGEEVEITEPEFSVTANKPVSFPLYASSTRLGDPAGAVVRAPLDTVTELPPIRTVLRFGKKLHTATLPVHLLARLTEVGTLEVWCRSLTTDHRWRLQFEVRDALAGAGEEEGANAGEGELAISPERLADAIASLRTVFPPDASPALGDPVGLTRLLEERLAAGKDAWPLEAIRKLWDALWEGREIRSLDQAHEARWLNLCGFLLRPGFGHELDDWRLQQLWRIFPDGLYFPRAVQCRVEWWNLWKRVAGGLTRPQQQELYNQTAPYLLPRLKSKIKERKSSVGPQELREYWQLLANCERLSASARAELGQALIGAVARGKATDAEAWALARFGSRAPMAGPLDCVVDRKTVESWVEQLLAREWRRPELLGFVAVQLARCVGDRERDLDDSLRQRLAARLRALPGGERMARLVTEPLPLEFQERARIFDESLPLGLVIADRSNRSDGSAR